MNIIKVTVFIMFLIPYC